MTAMICPETVGMGGKNQERLPLLIPKFFGSYEEISSFFLTTDAGIIPVHYLSFKSTERLGRTFQNETFWKILISYISVFQLIFLWV